MTTITATAPEPKTRLSTAARLAALRDWLTRGLSIEQAIEKAGQCWNVRASRIEKDLQTIKAGFIREAWAEDRLFYLSLARRQKDHLIAQANELLDQCDDQQRKLRLLTFLASLAQQRHKLMMELFRLRDEQRRRAEEEEDFLDFEAEDAEEPSAPTPSTIPHNSPPPETPPHETPPPESPPRQQGFNHLNPHPETPPPESPQRQQGFNHLNPHPETPPPESPQRQQGFENEKDRHNSPPRQQGQSSPPAAARDIARDTAPAANPEGTSPIRPGQRPGSPAATSAQALKGRSPMRPADTSAVGAANSPPTSAHAGPTAPAQAQRKHTVSTLPVQRIPWEVAAEVLHQPIDTFFVPLSVVGELAENKPGRPNRVGGPMC
jgi:hypothetical protein